jgi:hypothetical protein
MLTYMLYWCYILNQTICSRHKQPSQQMKEMSFMHEFTALETYLRDHEVRPSLQLLGATLPTEDQVTQQQQIYHENV